MLSHLRTVWDQVDTQGTLAKDIVCLKQSDMPEWVLRATTLSDCAQVGELLANASNHLPATEDSRFGRAVALLQDSLRRGDPLSREQLAHVLGFSPSRFSHWFTEQAGLSFKSYRKWQKLRLSLQALLDGETLATAAYSGGFADQAHLSRSFVAAFGITFGQAATALSHE